MHTNNPDHLWDCFFAELSSVETMQGVRELLRKQPLPGDPGRAYYSNLSQFIQFLTIPEAAVPAELAQYLRLIRHLGPGLGAPPSEIDNIEGSLMDEIERRYAAPDRSQLSPLERCINKQIKEQLEILRMHVRGGNLDLEFVAVHAHQLAQLTAEVARP